MIKLVISDNEGTTTVVPLVRDEISIGRKEGNTIRLTERNVSREHCKLERKNGSYVVHDLRSYNGVVLNGQRIVGESPLKPGDEIQIGDYTLQLQLEAREREDTDAEPTRVSQVPRSAAPARLFVLTPPLAGAEFSLPERGELRIGRAPELDITLDHRSVSREHAKVACDSGSARIIDAGSVNGVIVNREKVSEARLAAGDVIELGDVLLRYVGPGEHYVFDPAEVRSLLAPRHPKARTAQLRAIAVVAGAVALAIAIARGGQKAPPSEPSSPPAKAVVEPVAAPAPVAVAAAAAATEVSHFAQLVDDCRRANEGGRYAEAVAHANAALKARPDAPEARTCLETASLNHEQEQIYVRAKAALAADDFETAWKELASLRARSAVRQRPEVEAAVEDAARKRLSQAQNALKKRPDDAAELAAEVERVEGLPEPIAAQALGVINRANSAHPPKNAKPEPAPRAAAEARSKSSAPSHTAAAPTPAAHNTSDKSPMEVASACLARGDNACVIRTLNGRAQSSQELGLLIETYRAMGDTTQAFRNMAVYVQRFPTARRADAYRQMLQRQGQ